jgi:hypothetical protein
MQDRMKAGRIQYGLSSNKTVPGIYNSEKSKTGWGNDYSLLR